MFTIEMDLPKRRTSLDVDGNACRTYCWMTDIVEKELKVSVQKEIVCVDAGCLRLSTSRENEASYEWSMADMEEKVVTLTVDDEIDDPELTAYLNEDDELDLMRLIGDKSAYGETCLFSLKEKVSSKTYGDYENSYCMTYDASGQTVRLDYASTQEKPYEEGISGSIFNEGITSWIKYFTIDEIISFDFCNTPFVTLMQKIGVYCEQEHLEFTVDCREYGIPGHSIDIPCAIVETDRFKVVFDLCGDVKEVYVAKGIMDTSSYVDSNGKTYVIGDIIWKIQSQDRKLGSIYGFGAENIWHRYHGEESKYIYSCGFNF